MCVFIHRDDIHDKQYPESSDQLVYSHMCRFVTKLLNSLYLHVTCCAFSLFYSCAILLLLLLMPRVHLVVDSTAMKGISGECKHVRLKANCAWHERTVKLT